LKVNPPP